MADNFGISTGSDATISADDVGSGVLVQLVKLDLGAPGATAQAQQPDATLAGLPVVPRYKRLRIAQTPTISNGAIYAAKDAVGGIMTFANAARASGGSGVIRAAALIDKGQQVGHTTDLVLFDQTIAGTVTDNNAFDPDDATLANLIGYVTFTATTGFRDFNDNAVAFAQCEIPYVCAATSLFGALVARGTPTYTSTSDLTVVLTVDLD